MLHAWLLLLQGIVFLSQRQLGTKLTVHAAVSAGNSSKMEQQQQQKLPGSSARAAGVAGAAPPGSLAARLALHALVFQNPRAVAAVWMRWGLFRLTSAHTGAT